MLKYVQLPIFQGNREKYGTVGVLFHRTWKHMVRLRIYFVESAEVKYG